MGATGYGQHRNPLEIPGMNLESTGNTRNEPGITWKALELPGKHWSEPGKTWKSVQWVGITWKIAIPVSPDGAWRVAFWLVFWPGAPFMGAAGHGQPRKTPEYPGVNLEKPGIPWSEPGKTWKTLE